MIESKSGRIRRVKGCGRNKQNWSPKLIYVSSITTTVCDHTDSNRGANICGDDAIASTLVSKRNKSVRTNTQGHGRSKDDRKPRRRRSPVH